MKRKLNVTSCELSNWRRGIYGVEAALGAAIVSVLPLPVVLALGPMGLDPVHGTQSRMLRSLRTSQHSIARETGGSRVVRHKARAAIGKRAAFGATRLARRLPMGRLSGPVARKALRVAGPIVAAGWAFAETWRLAGRQHAQTGKHED